MKWKPARLSTTEFLAGLSVKILLGFLYGYIYLTYYNGDDTWRFQRVSIDETALLLNDPASFFIREFTPAHALSEGKGWRQIVSLYLNDLQYALVVKTLAILNVVTRGNYFINSAIFNLIFFWGHYWLFVTFSSLFPEKRNLFYWISFFFVPAVFWLSGLRIDGWLFFFLSLFIYVLYNRSLRLRVFLMFVATAGIVVARPEVAGLIIPAGLGYLLSKRMSSLKAYGVSILISACIFFSSPVWMGGGGLPAEVASKQHLFLQLEGTRFSLPELTTSFVSYANVLPYAFANTFIRPFPWEATGFLQLMASGEIMLFWIILGLTLTSMGKDWRSRLKNPVILFMLVVATGIYLSVGYLVPFPGAIIRYKASALLVLVMIMAALSKIKTN